MTLWFLHLHLGRKLAGHIHYSSRSLIQAPLLLSHFVLYLRVPGLGANCWMWGEEDAPGWSEGWSWCCVTQRIWQGSLQRLIAMWPIAAHAGWFTSSGRDRTRTTEALCTNCSIYTYWLIWDGSLFIISLFFNFPAKFETFWYFTIKMTLSSSGASTEPASQILYYNDCWN